MPELYPYQEEGVEFLIGRRAALLADEPGLGKTPQAICAAEKLKAKKVLILCPAGLKLNWKREVETWKKAPLKIQVLDGRADKIHPWTDVLILNYDLLISPSIFEALIRLRFAVGIFDESHFLKNRDAKRTKAVFLKGGVASRCVYQWYLTGTPILNRPVELYPVLKAAAPHTIEPYSSFTSFAMRFCEGYLDDYNGVVAKGATNMDDLCHRLSGFMLRRLKKDHLKDLPAKRYQMIAIPAVNAEIVKLVRREFTFSKDDARAVRVGGDGAELAVMRHALALSKVGTCIEHIKNVLEETDKVVIFAYHKDVIAALVKGLYDYCPAGITGDTPSIVRQEMVDQFQNDPRRRVFIGQIQAAGIGITLTAASTVIFVETDWVPGIVDQATDRCHRIGQKDSVLVQFLVIQDSLEEYMVRTMIDKKENIAKIIDQDPAVAEIFT